MSRTFWRFFWMQVLAYGVVDFSNRCVAQGNVSLSVSSGMVYAWLAFNVIRRVGEAKENTAIYGYIAGSGIGTWVGIATSKMVMGK